MTINMTNLSAVLQQKIDALSATSEFKDLLYLAKAIEAAAGNVSVSDVLSAGATQVAAVNSAGSTQVGNVNSAAASRISAINALDAVVKRSMQSYTFETVDLNTLNTVGEQRYVDAANSPNAPAGGAGYGYYMGVAGGDAGATLGLQHLASQNGRYWWRDKYGGGWREFWHSGNVTLDTAATSNTVAKRGADGSLTAAGLNVAAAGVATARIRDTTTGPGGFAQLILQDDGAPLDKRRISLRTFDSGGFSIGRLNDAENEYASWVVADATGSLTFYRSVNPDPVSVPFAATIALNFAASNRFDLIATGNFTLANPSGMKPGQVIVMNVTCSAANIVMALGSFFKTKGGAGVALSTTSGARDKIIMECNSSTAIDITIQKDWK